LRHGHCALALAAGVNPRVVQERLGHSSVAFPLDRYSHVVPAMQEDAAETVARLIGLDP
jgi:integrase